MVKEIEHLRLCSQKSEIKVKQLTEKERQLKETMAIVEV
jgi:hypothetical protein